ncbi:MAG: O-antigen ligase family protein [Acidobacteria bacterium]|nr:O-antigen ligase family protein [Acidobacteriota bacterium]
MALVTRYLSSSSPFAWIGYGALIGYAATAPFSILVSQSFLVVGLLTLAAGAPRVRCRFRTARMGWFAAGTAGYAATSVLSAALSQSPAESLADCKSLLLLLLPFAAVAFLSDDRRWWGFIGTAALSTSIAALYGVYQYWFLLGAAGVSTRAHGFFSVWTTYGQFMMLATVFAATVTLSAVLRARRICAGVVAVCAGAAMGLSFVRGAWVGTAAAGGVFLTLRRPKLLAFGPLVLLYVLILAPPSIFSRVMSIFSLRDESNRDRIDMIRSGARMIRDHPFLGVGPNMVGRAYMLYRMPGSFPRINPHLHNNLVQIAAERGIIAFGFWCLMLAAYLRQAWSGTSPLHRASFLSVVSFLVAGLFDFNFGDSEIVMPVLVMLGLPFALAHGDSSSSSDGTARATI